MSVITLRRVIIYLIKDYLKVNSLIINKCEFIRDLLLLLIFDFLLSNDLFSINISTRGHQLAILLLWPGIDLNSNLAI